MFKVAKARKRQFKRDSITTRIHGTTPSKRQRKQKSRNCQTWSNKFLLKLATAEYIRAVENGEVKGDFDGDKTSTGKHRETFGKVIIPK